MHNGKKLYMLQRLNTFLLEELRRGCNVALLIDEAQELAPAGLYHALSAVEGLKPWRSSAKESRSVPPVE